MQRHPDEFGFSVAPRNSGVYKRRNSNHMGRGPSYSQVISQDLVEQQNNPVVNQPSAPMQYTETRLPTDHTLHATKGRKKAPKILLATALASAVLGLIVWVVSAVRQQPKIASSQAPQVSNQVNSATSTKPNAPIKLKADGHKTVLIEELTTKNDQSFALPRNSKNAGWLSAHGSPGQEGKAVVLSGLANSADSAFADIPKLQIGGQITLETSEGKRITYEVISTRAYMVDQTDSKFFEPYRGGPGLNLIVEINDQPNKEDNYRLAVFALEV